MSEKNDDMDGLLDSILDDIQHVDDEGKKSKEKKEKSTVKVVRPKLIILKPKTIKIGESTTSIQSSTQVELPKREEPSYKSYSKLKESIKKPRLKNIERLKLQGEADRLGIPFEELLRRKGLEGEYKLPIKPKPLPPKKEDRLLVKKVKPKEVEQKIVMKPQPLEIVKPAPVYLASIPTSSSTGPTEYKERKERVKKIKFTEKLEEDTIGYKSPLAFRRERSAQSKYVNVTETKIPEAEKNKKKIDVDSVKELEDDRHYVPNVGGVPLFVDDTGNNELDEELITDENGYLSKAFGIKCPQCGYRFEQGDPERAECPKCHHVWWV